MSGILTDGIIQLQEIGLFDTLIPFMLIFTIVFGVMTKVKIFEDKKFNVIIALGLSLITVFQHIIYPGSQYDVIGVINSALPQVSLVMVAVVMLFLILGLFGKIPMLGEDRVSGVVGFLAVLVIVYIFGSSAGLNWWGDLPNWLYDREVYALVVVLLVFGLIIRYITGKDEHAEAEESWLKDAAKFFGGGAGGAHPPKKGGDHH